MITVPVGMRVLVVTKPVDFRKGATSRHREVVANSQHLSGITQVESRARAEKIILANLCASLGTGQTPS